MLPSSNECSLMVLLLLSGFIVAQWFYFCSMVLSDMSVHVNDNELGSRNRMTKVAVVMIHNAVNDSLADRYIVIF